MKFRNKKLSKDFKSNFKQELCFIEWWNYDKTQATKFWRILFHETIKPRCQFESYRLNIDRWLQRCVYEDSGLERHAENEAW